MKEKFSLLLIPFLLFSYISSAQYMAWRKMDSSIYIEYCRYKKAEILSRLNEEIVSNRLKAYKTWDNNTHPLPYQGFNYTFQSKGVVFDALQGIYKSSASTTELLDNVIQLRIVDSLFSDRTRIGFLLDKYRVNDSSYIGREALYYVNISEAARFFTPEDSFFFRIISVFFNKDNKINADIYFRDSSLVHFATCEVKQSARKIFAAAFKGIQAYVAQGHTLNDSFKPLTNEVLTNKILDLMQVKTTRGSSKIDPYNPFFNSKIIGFGLLEQWHQDAQGLFTSTSAFSANFMIWVDLDKPIFYIKASDISKVLKTEELRWIEFINLYYTVRRLDEWGGFGRQYVREK